MIRESGLLYQAADEAADNSFAPELRWLGGQLEFVEAMRGLFLFQPEIHAYRWEIHRAVGMLLRINRPACLRYATQSLDVDAIDYVERAISVEAKRRWLEYLELVDGPLLESREKARIYAPVAQTKIGLSRYEELERTLELVAGWEVGPTTDHASAWEALKIVAGRTPWQKLKPPPDHIRYLKMAVTREYTRLLRRPRSHAEIGSEKLTERGARDLNLEGSALMVHALLLDLAKNDRERAYVLLLEAYDHNPTAYRKAGLTEGQAKAFRERAQRHLA